MSKEEDPVIKDQFGVDSSSRPSDVHYNEEPQDPRWNPNREDTGESQMKSYEDYDIACNQVHDAPRTWATGNWRYTKYTINPDECIECAKCWVYCPDGFIDPVPKDDTYKISQDYCKGCGICWNECPVDAIKKTAELDRAFAEFEGKETRFEEDEWDFHYRGTEATAAGVRAYHGFDPEDESTHHRTAEEKGPSAGRPNIDYDNDDPRFGGKGQDASDFVDESLNESASD